MQKAISYRLIELYKVLQESKDEDKKLCSIYTTFILKERKNS